MINVDQIVERLETLKETGTLLEVIGLGDIKDAPENTITTDSAYVMPPTKHGSENKLGTSRVDQKVTALCVVGIVFLGIGAGGAELTAHIQEVCDAVEAHLYGWAPGPGLSPFILISAGAEEVNTKKGYLIYSFIFETTYHARKP